MFPRPSPLRINRCSHVIQKPSSSSCSSSMVSGDKSLQQPVIIYDNSPKIIHTSARNFMTVVQNLTGMSSSTAPPERGRVSASPPPEDNSSSSSLEDKLECRIFQEHTDVISPTILMIMKIFEDY